MSKYPIREKQPQTVFLLIFITSPSFQGVEEPNSICRAADLDQVLPAHPQEVGTCNDSWTSVLLLLLGIATWQTALCAHFHFQCFFFTWEAEEEPWERWEPVLLQPLLSVLRWGRWQKVLHVKEKRSPWNENSSTASTVSTIWPKRNERAALTPSHRAALRYLHQSSRPGADPAGLENSFYTTHTCEEETRGFCDWLKVWLRCLQKKVFYLQKMCCGSQLLHIYSNK